MSVFGAKYIVPREQRIIYILIYTRRVYLSRGSKIGSASATFFSTNLLLDQTWG